jgi:tRNA(fMet)-specific endonuclease VapC
MSLSIFDTDTLSLLQNNHWPIIRRILAMPTSQLAVAVISVEEQLTGWQASLRRARSDAELALAYQSLADNVRYLSGLYVIGFSEAAIRRYSALLALKLNIGKMGLRVAAIALEEGAAVITRNLGDFGRVPGLACESWAD